MSEGEVNLNDFRLQQTHSGTKAGPIPSLVGVLWLRVILSDNSEKESNTTGVEKKREKIEYGRPHNIPLVGAKIRSYFHICKLSNNDVEASTKIIWLASLLLQSFFLKSLLNVAFLSKVQ